MAYRAVMHDVRYVFPELKTLMAKASPWRASDERAGIAAVSARERVAAQTALAEVPLARFLEEELVPGETDEVTRLIATQHDRRAFAPIAHLTVGELREWLLRDATREAELTAVRWGLTPEMVAASAKLMRVRDLVSVARKTRVVTRFRTTVGLAGRLATRLLVGHPTDAPAAIAAAFFDGLLYANGDALIAIDPAFDQADHVESLLEFVDGMRTRYRVPTQTCILAHVTTTLALLGKRHLGAPCPPVDLVHAAIAGTEAANRALGCDLALLAEARQAALALGRGEGQVMVFATGATGSPAGASLGPRHGVDAQTFEARAYAVARAFDPFLVSGAAGSLGTDCFLGRKQSLRAALEDHMCAKLLGVPLGGDVSAPSHGDIDEDDLDAQLTLLGVAGVGFVTGTPGGDDILRHGRGASFHDALYLRDVLGCRPAPEFEAWLAGAEGALLEGIRLLTREAS